MKKMGWACGTYGGEEECLQGCGEGTPVKKKKATWKSYCVTSSRRCDRNVVPSSSTGSQPRTP